MAKSENSFVLSMGYTCYENWESVSGGFNLAAKTQLASGIAGRAPLNEAELSDRLAVPQARMNSVTLKSLSEAGHGGNPSDPLDPRKDH